MRFLSLLFGGALLLLSVTGLAALAFGPRDTIQLELTRAWVAIRGASTAPAHQVEAVFDDLDQSSGEPAGAQPAQSNAAQQAATGALSSARAAITHVALPSIRVTAGVVPARRVRVGTVQTWEVPAHKAGHADSTAGAGAPGNAVLFGHVSSLNDGNVFKDLDRVRPGDAIELSDGERTYTYRVTELRRVTRDDTSVVETSEEPLLTLITCTGTWLPREHDYSHRLVVRATLQAAA